MRLAIGLVVLFCSVFAIAAQPPVPAPAPKPRPDLAFTIPGQGQRRVSDYLGKTLVLEFIHTTCSSCAGAVEELQTLQREFGPQEFQAIAIAFNPNADLLTPEFSKDKHFSLPVGWTVGNDVASFLGYGPADRFVVPQIVLIDRAGVVKYQTKVQVRLKADDDLRTQATLRQRIAELLHPEPPKSPTTAKRRS